MSRLILVRHAAVAPDLTRPAREWPLSDVGRASLPRLIDHVRRAPPDIVVASPEPKAHDTGRAISDTLAIPIELHDGVREHHRERVPYMEKDEWLRRVRRFFDEPDARVLGEETANEAYARFRTAIDEILDRHAARDVAVATHGTVTSLFLSRLTKEDPYEIGLRLGFPAVVTLERPHLRVVEFVGAI